MTSGRDVVFDPALVKGKTTRGARGRLSDDEALRQLLAGSGLAFERTATGGFVVRPARASGAAEPFSQSAPQGVEELVVTAQKRGEELLKDVPVPVSVLRTDSLASAQNTRIRDYFLTVPGLNISPTTGGGQGLSIRGVTTGGGGIPTVGFLIDDIPMGSSAGFGGSLVPDIDPGNLARIEVLRGPQGTLYGARAMGGLVNYITQNPSTSRLYGRVEAGVFGIDGGDKLGPSVRGSINLPISSAVALQASGFARNEPGYVDNVLTNRKDVNSTDAAGGRVALLVAPSDSFSVKLAGLYETIRLDGSPDVFRSLAVGGFLQAYVGDSGQTGRKTQLYSAHVNAKLGFADLTSITSFNRFIYTSVWDRTPPYTAIAQQNYGVPAAILDSYFSTKKFTQEVRLANDQSSRLQWLLGGFFTHEFMIQRSGNFAVRSPSGERVGPILTSPRRKFFDEYAVFGNLTYKFTDRFDLQLGGRSSWIGVGEQAIAGVASVPQVTAPPIPPLKIKATALTYLVTPRYKLSDDTMAYLRFASGYRPSLPNRPVSVELDGAPAAATPDKTNSYEFGLKTSALDGKLNLEFSAFYIGWKDIQLELVGVRSGGLNFTTNGSAARSKGFELSGTLKPLAGTTLTGWVAYTDARLTQDLPAGGPVRGRKGEPLADTSKWSGYLTARQDFPLTEALTGFVSGSASFRGHRFDVFTATGVRKEKPAFTRLDLNAGAEVDGWSVTLFANNLTNKRGILSFGEAAIAYDSITYIQPRTVGLSVAKTF